MRITIEGTQGSGKSELVKDIINSLRYKEDNVNILVFDNGEWIKYGDHNTCHINHLIEVRQIP